MRVAANALPAARERPQRWACWDRIRAGRGRIAAISICCWKSPTRSASFPGTTICGLADGRGLADQDRHSQISRRIRRLYQSRTNPSGYQEQDPVPAVAGGGARPRQRARLADHQQPGRLGRRRCGRSSKKSVRAGVTDELDSEKKRSSPERRFPDVLRPTARPTNLWEDLIHGHRHSRRQRNRNRRSRTP